MPANPIRLSPRSRRESEFNFFLRAVFTLAAAGADSAAFAREARAGASPGCSPPPGAIAAAVARWFA